MNYARVFGTLGPVCINCNVSYRGRKPLKNAEIRCWLLYGCECAEVRIIDSLIKTNVGSYRNLQNNSRTYNSILPQLQPLNRISNYHHFTARIYVH